MLKIHYLCGDKDNFKDTLKDKECVVICSKFITFAVTKTTNGHVDTLGKCCDLLKIHYLCGDKDNPLMILKTSLLVVICSKFITFAVTKTTVERCRVHKQSCDLLKIHYLCGDKDNERHNYRTSKTVVICSKFITFAVTKTTIPVFLRCKSML